MFLILGMNAFTLPVPERRKFVSHQKEAPFPVPVQKQSSQLYGGQKFMVYTGYLVGGVVLVQHSGDMKHLYSMVRYIALCLYIERS